MSAQTKSSHDVPYNKGMFRWARQWRLRSIDEVAEKLKKPPELIEAWENDESNKAPTVKQARQLADFYDRPFLEFFWDSPPDIQLPNLIPDFRRRNSTASPSERRELIEIQAWAESQRLNALDLYEMLGEKFEEFPRELVGEVTDSAEDMATLARQSIKFSIEDQLVIAPSKRPELTALIRNRLESSGILVLKNSALAKYGASGFCLSEFPLPVIVFGKESPAAQSFTMVHELGHLILRQSAISCDTGETQAMPARAKSVEHWCDNFAGAFLIPKSTLSKRIQVPTEPQPDISDEIVRSLSDTFKVSEHAMIVRLVQLRYVAASYYWNIKRPLLLEEERKFKAFGRSSYYGSRFRNTFGDLYTGLVLEAWSRERISNHSAAEFMGIKNIAHLDDIRDNFAS